MNCILISEKLATIKSDYLIADSVEIKEYIKGKLESEYIAYGADVFDTPNESVLSEYKL